MHLLDKRSRLWVDPSFQLRLMLRMGGYLLVYVFILWHVGFFFDMMQATVSAGVPRSAVELYVAYFTKQQWLLYTLVLLFPTYCYDLIKFSHRVAGPLVRCRTLMRDMAEGKIVPEFKPRKYDLMRNLFDAFNALIRQCNARVTRDCNGSASGFGTATPVQHAAGEVGAVDSGALTAAR